MVDELNRESALNYRVVSNEITIMNDRMQFKHHQFVEVHESHLNDYHNFHEKKEQFPDSLSSLNNKDNSLPPHAMNGWVSIFHYLSSMIVHNDQYALEEGYEHLFLKSP